MTRLTRRLKTVVAAAAVTLAAMPAGASAMSARNAETGTAPIASTASGTTSSSGFHWGDAGIGAAAAALLAGVGATVTLRRRPVHR